MLNQHLLDNDINVHSSSIKYLKLERVTCDFCELSHLIQYTPYLQRISVNSIYGFPDQQVHAPMLSITSMKILYHGYIATLINLFQNLSNLLYLTLETFDIYCDGCEWEQILMTYLSTLKIFQLKMI